MKNLTRVFCYLDKITKNYDLVLYTKSNFLVIRHKQKPPVRFYMPPEQIQRGTVAYRLLRADRLSPPGQFKTWDGFISAYIKSMSTSAKREERKQLQVDSREKLMLI